MSILSKTCCLSSESRLHGGFHDMGCFNSTIKERLSIVDTVEVALHSKDDISEHVYSHIIGFTHKQKLILKQTWKEIRKQMESIGVEILAKFFRSHYNIAKIFKNAQSQDENEPYEDMEQHAAMLMATMDSSLMHIDSLDFVQLCLHKVAASHIKISEFKPETFMDIKVPFLEAVEVALGPRYTGTVKQLYYITITFILQTMIDGFNDALKEIGESSTDLS